MGALHHGHLKLVESIKAQCDFVCLWIFVNPTQFNDSKDYETYPRDLEQDFRLAESAGVDLVFAPQVESIYPGGIDAYDSGRAARVIAGGRSHSLEGERRPGHFDGVTHVCTVFFNILEPDVVAFGEKDYQQLKVVTQLVEDLAFPIEILSVPIVRDSNGLAFSSRNALLSNPKRALVLYDSMVEAKNLITQGETSVELLTKGIERYFKSVDYRSDYIAFVEAESLSPVSRIEGSVHLLLAVYADNNVRLIDNMRLI